MKKQIISVWVIGLQLLVNGVAAQKAPLGQEPYKAPEWAKGVVWYQIFPERFRDGDTTNQPTRQRAQGPEGWRPSVWTADWYAMEDWAKKGATDFYTYVNNRRHGGDLQGVLDKLDYLKNLGVGAIYFNPVFDAQSLHKYDASYFHHIDRNFGPDPKGDEALFAAENAGDPSTWRWSAADTLFLKLIKEAHSRNIKVVIDGVWNHTGTQFWAFQDVLKRGIESPYKDWYVVTAFDNPGTPDKNEFDYEGWWGHKSLPVFREKEENLVLPIREHLFAVTRRWMDPNGDGNPEDGIDGWRLDVAEEVGKAWWKEWHALVRQLNPDAITVAEIWTEKAKEFIAGDMFTSVMNYRFAYAVKDFLIDDSINTKEFISRLQQIERDYPAGAGHVLQNLMDSHDAARLASIIVNPGRQYDRLGHPRDGFDVRKPNKRERDIQKLVALFQFTWKGAPMIYYGTEAGMWGADDPDDRKPMVWEDLQYAPETHHPFGGQRPVDSNNFDRELFTFYQSLAHMRNREPALQKGTATILFDDPEKKLVLFKRHLGSDEILVLLNRSDAVQTIDVSKWTRKNKFRELLLQKNIQGTKIGVPPMSILVVK
jgi:glycosidase